MIIKILPITENKLNVLTQIYMYNKINGGNIATLLKYSNQLVYRTLNELNPVLDFHIIGRNKYYSIKKNFIKPLEPLINKIRLEKSFGINSNLFEFILNSTFNIDELFVFGSYVKRTNSLDSDIDLIIVSNDDKKEIKTFLISLERKLQLKFDAFIFTNLEFEKIKRDKNNNFYYILENTSEFIKIK